MKTTNILLILLLANPVVFSNAQDYSIRSPDNKIVVNINNTQRLTYSVTFKGQIIIDKSPMGFEFRDEQPMSGNFEVMDQKTKSVYEKWTPVVKSKHAEIIDSYNELHLYLKER